jgi:TolB-like protein
MTTSSRLIEFGAFHLDCDEHRLIAADGTSTQLSRRLFKLLEFMLEHPGRLLTKEMILDSVWHGTVVEENTLSRTMSMLRRALGETADRSRYIETVQGMGYRFAMEVTVARPSRATDGSTQLFSGRTQATSRAIPPSVAVLPFDDLSPEQNQSHVADGVAEEILNRLARISKLRIIAKTSSFMYRPRRETASDSVRATETDAGHELGVDYLLVGSVRKAGSSLRITAQLVDAESKLQLWSERFDRPITEVFSIQDDIARAVAQALDGHLGHATAADVTETANLEAYDRYLRAQATMQQSGRQAILRSIELYQEALSLDPEFAPAWVGLANAARATFVWAPERAREARGILDEAGKQSIALAPDWWASHLAGAWRCSLRRDWLGVDRALTEAERHAPGQPVDIAFDRAVLCAHAGHTSDSVEGLRRAIRDNPLSLLWSGLLQKQLHVAGRDGEAEAEYRRSFDLPGDRDMVEHLRVHRAWARGETGAKELRRYLEHQTFPFPVLADVLEVFDEPTKALALLREAATAPEYGPPTHQLILAWWLAHLGDADTAFERLWQAYVKIGGGNVSWLWLPVLADVRRNARFAEIVEVVDLPRFWSTKGRGCEHWQA